MGKSNILVVDDLQSMRLTLGGILEDEGYNVVTVEDGYRAIEAVKKTHFEAIFMDIKMPGINGVQTFREIRKIDPKSAVIMMTAYSVEDLVKEALEEGAYTIIYKPFDIGKIIAIIKELLLDKTLVLVVDDLAGDRETIKAMLEEEGHRVTTASNGDEAIQLVKGKHYDVILLDVVMPGMDGIQTFERVKEIDPQVAVLMMTGYSEEELMERAIRVGSYTYIRKPIDVERVLAVLKNISREKKG